MISYSAVDRNGNLPLYGILNLLQDCTNMQSSSIGMGVEHMKQVNKGWILVSYKISLKKKLRYGEKVRVGTAASSFSSFYGDRKFQIESLDGEKLVEADSIWVLMDMETRHPIRVSEKERKGYVIEEGINDLKADRKIKFSSEREKVGEFKVLKTYIDNNGHMNNADYLRVAAEFVPADFEYHEVDIIYNKEAMEGEMMTAYLHREENVIEITFEDKDENVLAKVRLQNK
ncbi:acyl-[acyl-carrier-protein] thioesterase [Eubacterium sp.]